MKRKGLTLVELLVVIVLLLIITAVAIPIIAPNNETRRIRESARLVSTFLSGARNRAIELGRPVGVQFERLASNPNAAMVLSYVEVPPTYAGDTLSSQCAVYWDGNAAPGSARVNMNIANDSSFNPSIVRVGDMIRFNFQGRSYRITGPATSATDKTIATGTTILEIAAPEDAVLPWQTSTDNGATVPLAVYQITRQPMKSSDAPMQLPEGAVVDLRLSGEGGDWIHFDQVSAANNPVVMFAPSGGVSAIQHFDDPASPVLLYSRAPASSLHFMIGRSDGVGTADSEFTDPTRTPWNLRDLNNLWVSIGTQSGMVSTTENARVSVATSPGIAAGSSFDLQTAINEARSIARSHQSMGGR